MVGVTYRFTPTSINCTLSEVVVVTSPVVVVLVTYASREPTMNFASSPSTTAM